MFFDTCTDWIPFVALEISETDYIIFNSSIPYSTFPGIGESDLDVFSARVFPTWPVCKVRTFNKNTVPGR